jgi:hypothetical protein
MQITYYREVSNKENRHSTSLRQHTEVVYQGPEQIQHFFKPRSVDVVPTRDGGLTRQQAMHVLVWTILFIWHFLIYCRACRPRNWDYWWLYLYSVSSYNDPPILTNQRPNLPQLESWHQLRAAKTSLPLIYRTRRKRVGTPGIDWLIPGEWRPNNELDAAEMDDGEERRVAAFPSWCRLQVAAREP